MRLIRPIPPHVLRFTTPLILLLWLVQMGCLVHAVRRDARGSSLAADLARYGSSAQWRGIYLRGEKIGFSVTQTVAKDDGYEIQEDARLRMTLLGMTTVTRLRSLAEVDREYALRFFSCALDPGTGPVEVQGRVDGRELYLTFRTSAGTREERRTLRDRPTLSLNLTRQLVRAGLKQGQRFELTLLDPVTLADAPATVEVLDSQVLSLGGFPVPTRRVKTRFLGLEATMWVTDTGEVVREESPLGMVVLKEDARRATTLSTAGTAHADLLQIASVVPATTERFPDPANVERLRVRVVGAEALLGKPEADGAGQTRLAPDVLEIRHGSLLQPEAPDPERSRYLLPEPFIESDDAGIRAEAQRVVAGVSDSQARAERLLRHVHALLDKRPTVSLPSAAEVLRTRVGDCNEHAVLYVALARAAGVPARIAVGLVYLLGAFRYHAWAEVYVERPGGGLWMSVDPTFNQFPADATHIRLAQGGLAEQAAITAAIGRIKIAVLEVAQRPGSGRPVIGQPREDMQPLDIPLPRRGGGRATCWGDRRDSAGP